jgi:hypothetical protein
MPTIEQFLSNDADFIYGCEVLFNVKPKKKAQRKAIEELGELIVALAQSQNKPSEKDRMKILSELVDVQQHITLLQRDYSDEEKAAVVTEKTQKMLASDDFKKWDEKSKRPDKVKQGV